ncbi:FCD domain-containing protein [Alkalihalobacillus sp. LMS39]|uniref:FadR/GntR family transcriptional regulator n=1 Tax=Alkalihalobacillus sp. LMS39 TaxID=2924032 RepID=UPI001FB430DA|nr:FCD domain-containing protein [Alkalihalobacillus sp. LMS39]UOE94020.1 FCD domain-containing protein [Alkalihalobacillus sp. LMS39]
MSKISIEREFFSNKGELAEYFLMRSLSETIEPIGSWVLQSRLEENGLQVSIATVGRMLKALDAKKYSILVENQGRLLTEEGQRVFKGLSEEIDRRKLQKSLMTASQPNDLDELLDLMIARKTIECETARLAASRASKKQIDALYHCINEHEHQVCSKKDPNLVACNFHESVAEASQNRFLIAALKILIYEEIKLESKISYLVTREKGQEYVKHHTLVADAISAGDEKKAVKYMREHMDSMILAIQKQNEI